MIIAIHSEQEIQEQLKSDGRWMIFKHSDTCSLSSKAYDEVQGFDSGDTEIPILMLEVKSQRPLSNWIEEELETRHESPQVLIFKSDKLKEVKNHQSITSKGLEHLVNGGYAG